MKYLLVLVLGLWSSSSQACDICNCYLGLDPGYNKNTIGIRYNMLRTSLEHDDGSGLKVMHGGTGIGEMGENKLKQSFSGFEIFARYYPIPKLQIMATLPYQVNTISFDGNYETRGALSDATIVAMYQLANTMPGDSIKTRHRLFGGIGIKFPTGKSSGASDIDIPFAYDLYSGTGSTDYLALLSYIGRHKKLGWNVNANYKFNGESCNNYKYGNTFNSSQSVFYELKFNNSALLPHVGTVQELSDKDKFENIKQNETGESAYWSTAGVDFYFGNFSITTEARLPIYQNIDETMPENKLWFFSSFNFHF